ncbi:MAG: nitroreductase family deazaflavin-dependent oxidoreductase [Gammaproteobacteria bacterium]
MTAPRPISDTELALLKPLLRCFTAWNSFIYRVSGGMLMNTFQGAPICLVRMTGAKSGREREIPLMYVPWQDGIVLVASMGGAPKHPTWYHNLRANPEIEVTVGGKTRQLVARLATPEEKEEVWPACCEAYPDYALYQARTERDIPVFICAPRAAE